MARSRHNALTRDFCYMYTTCTGPSDPIRLCSPRGNLPFWSDSSVTLRKHVHVSPKTSLSAPRGRERGALSGSIWAFWGRGCEVDRVRRKGFSEMSTLLLTLINASSCNDSSPPYNKYGYLRSLPSSHVMATMRGALTGALSQRALSRQIRV